MSQGAHACTSQGQFACHILDLCTVTCHVPRHVTPHGHARMPFRNPCCMSAPAPCAAPPHRLPRTGTARGGASLRAHCGAVGTPRRVPEVQHTPSAQRPPCLALRRNPACICVAAPEPSRTTTSPTRTLRLVPAPHSARWGVRPAWCAVCNAACALRRHLTEPGRFVSRRLGLLLRRRAVDSKDA